MRDFAVLEPGHGFGNDLGMVEDIIADDHFDGGASPQGFPDGRSYVRAMVGERRWPTLKSLPSDLAYGVDGYLLVLWKVDDCRVLDATRRPDLSLRTVLGTRAHERLSDMSTPAFDLATLRSTGICPK